MSRRTAGFYAILLGSMIMGTRKLRKSRATRRQTTTTTAEVHHEDDLCRVEPSDSMETNHLEANLETTGEVQQAATDAPRRSPATFASSPWSWDLQP